MISEYWMILKNKTKSVNNLFIHKKNCKIYELYIEYITKKIFLLK